jgi:hypothetical protein
VQVAEHHVGLELADQRQTGLAVLGFADDLEVGFALEDQAIARSHQRMVIQQEHLDHRSSLFPRGVGLGTEQA